MNIEEGGERYGKWLFVNSAAVPVGTGGDEKNKIEFCNKEETILDISGVMDFGLK